MMETKTKTPLACIILAAGQGTRMKSARPKVLHEIAGSSLIRHVVAMCESSGADRIVVVVGPDMDVVREAVAPHACAVQESPRGTGDAVKAARAILGGFDGNIAVLFGDTPLVKPLSLEKLVSRKRESGASIVVGGFTPDDPAAYGRLVLDEEGSVLAIVEYADATEAQRAIVLCNGGIMLFDSADLWNLLDSLTNDNAKKEYYLTDCVATSAQKGGKVVFSEMTSREVLGINNRAQLAQAEEIMQDELRQAAMLAGVTMRDPRSVYLCEDTRFGRDVVIEPNVVFGPGVTVGDNVVIRSFSHIEGAKIENGATIGPFARLRPGAVVGCEAHIGNFVEIKKSDIGAGAKVNHLSYIGDASVGEKTNIGAGTITCNYDGHNKYRTEIGRDVFVGSQTAFVAPVKIGDGALIAAGSTISKEVPADALAFARSGQKNAEGGAKKFRLKRE